MPLNSIQSINEKQKNSNGLIIKFLREKFLYSTIESALGGDLMNTNSKAMSRSVAVIILLTSITTHLSSQCYSPESYQFMDYSEWQFWVEWGEPASPCDILYYELEYGNGWFEPGTGAGILVSPIYSNSFQLSSGEFCDAFVRSVCDCDGDGIPEYGDWIASIPVFIEYPDPGIQCEDIPYLLDPDAIPGGITGDELAFIGQFELDGLEYISATGSTEYVIWREFRVPSTGALNLSFFTYSAGGLDVYPTTSGFFISETCAGPQLMTTENIFSGDELFIESLDAGETYFIGVWNDDIYYGEQGTIPSETIRVQTSLTFSVAEPSTGSCPPPGNPILIVDPFFSDVGLIWDEPSSTCPIIDYSIHYASQPIPDPGNPPPGVVINAISPGVSLPSGTEYAWLRTNCDCEPADNPDGIGDSYSAWVPAMLCYAPGPPPSDAGAYCPGPNAEVVPVSQCLSSEENLLLFTGADAQWNLEENTCSSGPQHIVWRSFYSPDGGAIDVSIEQSFGGGGSIWDDYGFIVKEECSGATIHCQSSFTTEDQITVTGLSPGEEYVIGVWNTDFPHYFNPSSDVCTGPDYSYSDLHLKLCVPEAICNPPFDISVGIVTDHAANISWTANGSSSWNIEYGPTGFALGEGILVEEVGDSPYTIDGLDPMTDYQCYITAVCGDDSSPVLGPYSFTTEPSMWVVDVPSNGNAFCCEEFSVPETFNAGAFCQPIEYSFSDSIDGFGCSYTIYRDMIATDDCDNSISVTYEFSVTDNQIPCGCDGGYSFDEVAESGTIALSEDWAMMRSGYQAELKILRNEAGAWELDTIIPGAGLWSGAVQVSGNRFISRNKIYHYEAGQWSIEDSLFNSLNETEYNVASILDSTAAIYSPTGKLSIFELDESGWNEVAFFNRVCNSLDLSDGLLLTARQEGDTIGYVYRKNVDTWEQEQALLAPEGMDGLGLGADCAIDGDRLAMGHTYFGGLITYRFDGQNWVDGLFRTNPYLYSDIGYNTSFGSAIDIDGDLMVVGDYMNRTAGDFSGSTVVFSWAGNEWNPVANIVPYDHGQNHRFGGKVALDGEYLMTGVNTTYWIGYGNYNLGGSYWIYSCMTDFVDGFFISADSGHPIQCGDELPTANYQLGPGWGSDTTVESAITGTMACGDSLVRVISVSDTMGHFASVDQIYPIEDTIPPTVDCLENIVLVIPLGDTAIALPDMTTGLFVDDICDPDPTSSQSITEGTQMAPGIYPVTLTASDACGNSASCTTTVYVELSTGLTDLIENQIKIYPNPANDILNLEVLSVNTRMGFEIIDNIGRAISVGNLNSGSNSLDVSQLPIGLYQIRCWSYDQKHTEVFRFSIER